MLLRCFYNSNLCGREVFGSKTCLLHTHMHICMHTYTHRSHKFMHEHMKRRKTHTKSRCWGVSLRSWNKGKLLKNVSDSVMQSFVFQPPLCSWFPWFILTHRSLLSILCPLFFKSIFSLFLNLSLSFCPFYFPYLCPLKSPPLSFSLHALLISPVSSFHHTSSSLLLPSPRSPSPPLLL